MTTQKLKSDLFDNEGFICVPLFKCKKCEKFGIRTTWVPVYKGVWVCRYHDVFVSSDGEEITCD